jgi:hypothetical protein
LTWIILFYLSFFFDAFSFFLGRGDFFLIQNKDHLNICKPEDKNDFIYKTICQLIKEELHNKNLNYDKSKSLYFMNDKNVGNFRINDPFLW